MFDNRFKLHPYNEASAHSVVLNVNQLEYYTWIELPHHIGKFLNLYSVQEFNTPKGPVSVEFAEKVTRDCLRPWLKVETSLFNTECGFHMYKFQFVDTRTSDVISLYFAYNLQNDNPNKTDYIYMNNRNAEGFNPFTNSDGAGSTSNSSSDNDTSDSTTGSDSTSSSSVCCCGKCIYCNR